MKKIFLFIAITLCLSIISCKKDDGVSCTSCSSPQTASFQVCKEGDGNASVNGQNTNTSYNIYISDLQESGVECGN